VVEAASDEARALGVVPGQTPRQAEHCCPEAVVLLADRVAYEAAFAALLTALGTCSPTVQPDRAGWGAELDASGLELLFGPAPALASELLRRAARAGLQARVGLGPNRLVARLAGGMAKRGGCRIVAPSEAREFLEWLPLEYLPLGEESRERLVLLGLECLGQLLRLPRAGLAQQVGADALELVRAAEASGELLTPYRPAEWLTAETELEFPLETREQLMLALQPVVERLTAELRERYLGAGAVRVRCSSTVQGPKACPVSARSPNGLSHSPCCHGETVEPRSGSPVESLVEGDVSDALVARLPARTQEAQTIVEAAVGLVQAGESAEGRSPDWLELGLGDLGGLKSRQGELFGGQRLRRIQVARAVNELAGRFRGRLQAPAFGLRS
jgi:nucleotidyltransferase/DNA polymerase involved in DNA repair